MTKKQIYIAGKISGEDEEACRNKFKKVEEKLQKEYYVTNPFAEIERTNIWRSGKGKRKLTDEHDRGEIMRQNLFELISCDAIYLLSDWPQSEGAILEAMIAKALGLEIIHEEHRNAPK